jgi:pimeloyl-[acyl-carrier protein] methyl ester esterase
MTLDTFPPGAPAGDASQDQFLPIDDGQLRFRDVGRGPAVLLLHGWTLDLEMWAPQFAELARDYRLVALDRRGFGCSSGSPRLASDVADVQRLCRHLRLGPVALVGMSQGARVALKLAQLLPDQVSCVVLDGPPDLHTGAAAAADDDLPLTWYRTLVREHGLEAFRQEWSKHPLAQLRTADSRSRELLARMIARYPGKDLRSRSEPTGGSAEPEMPAPLRIPTLVLNGEFDLESRKRAAEALVLELPESEYEIIPAAGHLPNLDNPRAYNAILRDFLSRHVALPPRHSRQDHP